MKERVKQKKKVFINAVMAWDFLALNEIRWLTFWKMMYKIKY